MTSARDVVHYLDTSALVKLVVAEPETSALRSWLASPDLAVISSDLARTELARAVRRSHPDRVTRAREVLLRVDLVQLRPDDFDAAGRLEPADLRSLDALHLAAALTLGDELESIVTYDDRLAVAADVNGVRVTAPT